LLKLREMKTMNPKMTIKEMVKQANGEIRVRQTRTGCFVDRRG